MIVDFSVIISVGFGAGRPVGQFPIGGVALAILFGNAEEFLVFIVLIAFLKRRHRHRMKIVINHAIGVGLRVDFNDAKEGFAVGQRFAGGPFLLLDLVEHFDIVHHHVQSADGFGPPFAADDARDPFGIEQLHGLLGFPLEKGFVDVRDDREKGVIPHAIDVDRPKHAGERRGRGANHAVDGGMAFPLAGRVNSDDFTVERADAVVPVNAFRVIAQAVDVADAGEFVDVAEAFEMGDDGVIAHALRQIHPDQSEKRRQGCHILHRRIVNAEKADIFDVGIKQPRIETADSSAGKGFVELGIPFAKHVHVRHHGHRIGVKHVMDAVPRLHHIGIDIGGGLKGKDLPLGHPGIHQVKRASAVLFKNINTTAIEGFTDSGNKITDDMLRVGIS